MRRLTSLRRFYPGCALISGALALSLQPACVESEADPVAEAATCPTPDASDRGECTEYTPANLDDSFAGSWSSAEDREILPIHVTDPGGGLIRVTLSVGDTPSTADVRVKGASVDEIHYGVIVGVTGEKQQTFVFRAQGGQQYELLLAPFLTPGDGDNSFTASWTYEPNVDCYEHNDSVAEAKRIPLDKPISAFAHAGIVAGDGVLSGPGLIDFYKFELTEKTTLRLAVTKPDDQELAFEFWDAAGEARIAGIDYLAPGGTEALSEDVEFEPGTHYVRVHHFVVQHSTQTTEEPIPASWNHPYSLTVRRVSIDASSAAASAQCVPAQTTPPKITDNECVAYTPAEVSGSFSGGWVTGDDEQLLPIAITDPGGGLVSVTLGVEDVPTEVKVRLRGAPAGEEHEAILVGQGISESAQETFVFRAQGDTHYELVLSPFVTPLEDDVTSYSVSWSYAPNLDCYEHNDSVGAARKIPMDTPIQAFAHPGLVAGDSALVGSGAEDYYKFELTEATTVRLAATKPDDEAISFELLESPAGGVLTAVDPVGVGGTALFSDSVELAAGIHYVRVGYFVSQIPSLSARLPLPASWNQPYSLEVQAR